MNNNNFNEKIKKKSSKKPPKGKYFFGSVKVGERGQIVIPIRARKIFEINPGDQLLVLGEKRKGLGLIKASRLTRWLSKMMPDFDLEENDSESDLKEVS